MSIDKTRSKECGPHEKFCRSCGDTIKKKAEICPECGVKNNTTTFSHTQTQYCRSCGKEIYSEAEICPNCGVKNQSDDYMEADNSMLDGDIVNILTTGIGILLILAGLGAYTDGGGIISSFFIGTMYIIVGLILIPYIRNNFQKKHSLHTFGYKNSVEGSPVAAANTTSYCSICDSAVEDGIEREFAKEFVIFGIVLDKTVEGTNIYCRSCVNSEFS